MENPEFKIEMILPKDDIFIYGQDNEVTVKVTPVVKGTQGDGAREEICTGAWASHNSPVELVLIGAGLRGGDVSHSMRFDGNKEQVFTFKRRPDERGEGPCFLHLEVLQSGEEMSSISAYGKNVSAVPVVEQERKAGMVGR